MQGYENAIRAKNGETIEEHRAVVGKILSKMSDVAAVRAPSPVPIRPMLRLLLSSMLSAKIWKSWKISASDQARVLAGGPGARMVPGAPQPRVHHHRHRLQARGDVRVGHLVRR